MQQFPDARHEEMAWIDAATMGEIDRVMVEELEISLLQMMENAGRALADLVFARHRPQRVTVLTGPGGNGGGGLVAARHLANLGVDVDIVMTVGHDHLSPAAAQQAAIAARMGLAVSGLDSPTERLAGDVIVDAMVGYSLRGPLRGRAADAAVILATDDTPVVSLDVPSGLDASSGPAGNGPTVAADATLTLCLPKIGLRDAAVGDLYLADISVPPRVVTDCTGGPAPPFDRGRILHVLR